MTKPRRWLVDPGTALTSKPMHAKHLGKYPNRMGKQLGKPDAAPVGVY